MASLPPLTGYNLGGIDQFWFIPVDDVQSIPDEESNLIEQDIQLVGDAKFSVGYATQETLQFTENQNRDAQGNFYEQSLSGFYPKDQENIASLFEGMAAERFIVIFRDNNGYYKLLGSLANPCKFTATFESGDSANGRNGYSFEFTRTDVEKAPFYWGLINETKKVINANPCDDFADFSVNTQRPDQYGEVQFTDQSPNAIRRIWNFGDGFTSEQQNPTHIYAGGANETYSVTLLVIDNLGRASSITKTNYIQVQNDRLINEQLNGTQAIISLQNKVDPAQTKWADIRDSANNNIHTIGFSGNKVDYTEINNKVSGDPFIESFYDPNDNIFATEPTASVQWKIVNNLYAAFVNFGNQNIGFYQLSNVINFDRASYYLAVLEKNITSTIHNPFDTNPNKSAAGVSIGGGVVVTRDFDGLGNGNGYERNSNEFTLIELIGDSHKMQVIVDGYRGNAIANRPSSKTIHALHSRAQPDVDFYEMFFSHDPNDRSKYKSYINHTYGLNIL